MLRGDLPEPGSQHRLGIRHDPGRPPLRGSVLTHDPASAAFGHPEPLLQNDNRSATPVRAHQFPEMMVAVAGVA